MQRKSRWNQRLVSVLACMCLAPGALAYDQEVKRQADELASGLQRAGRRSLAVVDFVDLGGNVNQLGRFLAEELSVALSGLPMGLEVVDRGHLAAILKEKKLSADGLVDPTTTRQLGHVLGVEVLVIGSLTAFGESVRVTTKAIDANTAKLVASSRIDIAKVGTIKGLYESSMTAIGVATAATTSTAAQPAAAAPQGSGASHAAHAFDEAPRIVEQNKFAFELQGCELSGQTASCRLLASNRAPQARTLKVDDSSLLYDDSGNQYKIAEAAVANQEKVFHGTYGSGSVGLPLHRDVPVKVNLRFEDIASEATRATSLQIVCTDGQREFTVVFKDISFVAKSIEAGSLFGQVAGAATTEGLGAGQVPTDGDEIRGLAGELAKKGLGKLGAKLFGGKKKPEPQ